MAHADYDCCAVCDCKINYSSDATTKENICTDCLKALRAEGLSILDVDEFERWVKSEDKGKLKNVLEKVGYCECFYPNRIDDIIKLALK